MRARSIKPGFFKNDTLVTLPFEVRILFAGLWCMADRAGRMEDRPAKIKIELFPVDNVNISTMLDLLQTGGLISRYEAKGNRYIQIINFEKHQYPHIREPQSTIPAPYKHRERRVLARLTPDSPLLTPESIPPIPPASGDPKIWFEKIWKAYPKERRHGKDVALKRFLKSVVDVEAAKRCARALESYLGSEAVKKGYILRASKWFAEWEDHIGDTRDERSTGFSGYGPDFVPAPGTPRGGGFTSAGEILDRVRPISKVQSANEAVGRIESSANVRVVPGMAKTKLEENSGGGTGT